MPVIRGEIRFPKLSGRIDHHFYDAEKVRVVIEVEPKAPPVKAPEVRPKEFAPARQTIPAHSSKGSGNTGTWILIGGEVAVLTITILTDFLAGVGIADDVVTIPAALRMIGTGAARLIFPVVARRVALPGANTGAGMALKAAH